MCIRLIYISIFLYSSVFQCYVECRISNERRCVDADCSVPISLATTLLRYNADDSRLLSFPRNVRAKVFSKEAGDNPTLWEAEEDSSKKCLNYNVFELLINGKRGYVPKGLLREDRMLVKPNEVKVIVSTGRVDNSKENEIEGIQRKTNRLKFADKFKQNLSEEHQGKSISSISTDVAETPELPAANSKGLFSTIGGVSADSVPEISPDINPQPTRNYQVFDGTTFYDDLASEIPDSPPQVLSEAKKTPSLSKTPPLDESVKVTEKLVEKSPVTSMQPEFEAAGKETENNSRENVQSTETITQELKGNAIEQGLQEEGTPDSLESSSQSSMLGNIISSVSNFISSGSGASEIEEDEDEDEDETISVEEEEDDTDGESSGEKESSDDVDPSNFLEKDIRESKNMKDEGLIPNEDINLKEASHDPDKVSQIISSGKESGQEPIPGDTLEILQQNKNLSEEPLTQHNTSVEEIADEGVKNLPSNEDKDTNDNVSHFETDSTDGTLSNLVSDNVINQTLANVSLQRNTHEPAKDVKTPDNSTSDGGLGTETTESEAMKSAYEEYQHEPTKLSPEVNPEINDLENKTASADTLVEESHIELDTVNSVDSNISKEFSENDEVQEKYSKSDFKQSQVNPVLDDPNETAREHQIEPSAHDVLYGSRNIIKDSSEQLSSAETGHESKIVIEETKTEPHHVQDTNGLDLTDSSKNVQQTIESPTYVSEDKGSLGATSDERSWKDSKEDRLTLPNEEVKEEDGKEDSLKTPIVEMKQEFGKEDSSNTLSVESRQEDDKDYDLKTPSVEERKEDGIEIMSDEINQKDLGDTSVEDSVDRFVDSIPLDQTEATQEVPDQDTHLDEIDIANTLSPESSENISKDTEAVEDLTANPLLEESSEGLFSWLGPVFSLFASSPKPTQVETVVSFSGDSNLETVHIPFIKEESCQADGVGEEACETLQEVSGSKDVAWQDSLYSAKMSSTLDLLDRVPLEATIWLIITAVVVLVFSLGHYYIEAHRRDGPLVAVINKLEREVLILKKESCILEDKIHIAEEQLEAWNTNSSENDALIVELKQELEETKVAKMELEEQLAVLEKEVETVTESGMEMHRLLEESLSSHDGSQVLLSTVENLREKLERQENEIAGLSYSLSQKDVEVEELKEKLAQAAVVASGMEERIISITREKEEEALQLKDKHRQLIAQLEEVMETKALDETRVSTDMSKLRLMIEELQKTLAERDLELEEVKEVVKQLRSTDSNDKMDALFDVVGVRTRLKAAVTERDELREKFQEEEGARKLLEGHMKKITLEVEDLKNRFETAEKEKIEALTKLQVLSNYFKEKESQLQKELGLQESMWLQKQSDDHTIYEQMRSLREENEKYKLQNESLKKEIVEQESSFKIQLANTEQKAHENWVTSRQAERRLKEAQQEAAQLRNRLTMEKNTSSYSLDDSKPNISESNGDPSSPPPSLMFPPTTSPPFMMYPMPPPGDFVPPPPLMGSPYPSDSRPPPVGRISSPPLDPRFSPPLPLPYPPYDYPPYGHHSPSPPPPLPPHSHHRKVHKPQPREMSREQKDHGMSNFSPEADKTIRRNKR